MHTKCHSAHGGGGDNTCVPHRGDVRAGASDAREMAVGRVACEWSTHVYAGTVVRVCVCVLVGVAVSVGASL